MTAFRLTRESLAWLVVFGVVAAGEAWLTRALLTPDGAAYLDLADAVARGDGRTFVQGYWSPLYPLLAAVARVLARAVGADQLAAVHALNAGLAIAGGVVVHRLVLAVHARHHGGAAFPLALWQRCTWAAYVTCALVYARIDSVTPDLLLLVVLVGAVEELVRHGARRPVRLGLLLGAAFLAKTSSWPWLLVTWAWLASPLGVVASRPAAARGVAVTVAMLLAWLVPISVQAGRPTLGSTGRLNACWFLRDCDGQSPDTHRGEHARYATLTTSAGGEVTYARLADLAGTYPPWTDPTGWAAGLRTQRASPWALGALAGVVLDNLADAVRYLAVYLYLAALAPALLWWVVVRPRLSWGDDSRLALGCAVLGAIGIAQFVAVQVQPRLMAPFAWLHVAGVLAALLAASGAPASAQGGAQASAPAGAASIERGAAVPRVRRRRKEPAVRDVARAPGAGTNAGTGLARSLAWVPLLASLVATALVLQGDRANAESDARYRAELRDATWRASGGRVPRAVVVVGEAFPLVAHAKALDVAIVSQVLPVSVPALDAIDSRERQRLLQQAGGGTADVAWQRQPDGRVRVTALR